MVFSSLSFLFIFLPLTVLFYFSTDSHEIKNTVLLFASLAFYSWGEPKLLLLLLYVSVVSYYAGILLNKYEDDEPERKAIFIISVVLIVLNLFVFKYLSFSVNTFANIFGLDDIMDDLILPTGISFYTFQILSYVIDLYKKEIPVQTNYFKLLLYICLFPQLVAGPIVRYSSIQNEIDFRASNESETEIGVKRFIIGLSKKVLIANQVSKFAKIIYTSPHGTYDTGMYWLAAIAYSLEIYFDFSGYSDMAIGLGRMFGFHFAENFEHPYTSGSITEFWRRWHISLSSWFRDYIYIPLGGNRVSLKRYIVNIFIVWALTGLWHGASWNFVLWGLYYAILLCMEKFVLKKYLKKLPKVLSVIITFFFVTIGWMIFNLTDPSEFLHAIKMMFVPTRIDFLSMLANNTEIVLLFIFIPLGLLLSFPVGKVLTKKTARFKYAKSISDTWHIILLFLCTVFLIATSYNPFIYFRF